MTATVASRRQTRADLVMKPVLLFSVDVTVVNEIGQVVPDAEVSAIVRRQGTDVAGSTVSRRTGPDGSVQLGPLFPGSAEVVVRATSDNRVLSASASIQIGEASPPITIRVSLSARATGYVEFVGRLEPLHGMHGGLRVVGVPIHGPHLGIALNDPAGSVEPTGTFDVWNLSGEQCLSLSSIPWGWRLLDITYNGEDYTYRPFSFEPGTEISGVLIRVEPKTVDAGKPRVCTALAEQFAPSVLM